MSSHRGLLVTPIEEDIAVPLIDVDTGLDLIIPAGQCLIRVCVFRTPNSDPLTTGCTIILGTSGTPNEYINLGDGLTTNVLNSNMAQHKSIIDCLGSATDITPVITLDNDCNIGTIWIEFEYTNN